MSSGANITILMAFGSLGSRDEFKRLVTHHGSGRGWGDVVLIGDQVVVKDVIATAEPALRAQLDHLHRLAEERVNRGAMLHDASRDQLRDAMFEQARQRDLLARFGPRD